ncbi:MAG: DNA-processing protein DprA [Candidatus Zixiibacteriota bacterium]|nr:MAG: DNA-processing protein DprA [candidate division Zixibacteria bacterium]
MRTNLTSKELKEKLIDAIGLLAIPGVGSGRYNRLVKAFGSPSAVLHASRLELEAVSGISATIASNVKSLFDGSRACEIASRITELGWTVLFRDDPAYPQPLLNIPEADIPPLLFAEGELSGIDTAVAIVGTRHPTEQGRMFAYDLAASLARAGITVVSGMAEGIDAAAHKGALETGGRTVAVWGNSLDIVYPPANKTLACQIKKRGLVLSEYLPGTSPDRANFPERNRIISGLSEGVVVIEAGKKSGALITAERALGQGRELFAVPGRPGATMSQGTNALIKKGARLLTSIDDIFEELPRLRGEVLTKKFSQLPDMTDIETRIVDLFSQGPQQLDQLARMADLPVQEVMEFILALELKGIVREVSGKRFVLNEEYL